MWVLYKNKYRKVGTYKTPLIIKGRKYTHYYFKAEGEIFKFKRGDWRMYKIKPKTVPKTRTPTRRSRKRSPMKRSKRRISRKSPKRKSKKRSSKRRRQVIPPLRKGSLGKYGYSAESSVQTRHAALKKAVNGISRNSVIRKLNAVAVLQKNKNPRISKIFRADQRWVSKTL